MSKKSTGKLSFAQYIAYGMGAVAGNFLGNSVGYLGMQIYNIGLGVSASLVGFAIGIPRFIDAVTDPAMGHISDNTRTRLGRRRPYILIGGILCGIVFALMWNPGASWSKQTIFVYFLAISIVYSFVHTIWGVPYGALGLELTDDYKERTTIHAYKQFLAVIFSLAMPWMYKMCFWNWDKLTASGVGGVLRRVSLLVEGTHVKGAEVKGAGVVGLIFGLLIVVTAIIPFFCKERVYTQTQAKSNFGGTVRSAFRNRAYTLLTFGSVLAFFGLFVVQPFSTYINIYHIFGGDREAAATMLGWAGMCYTLLGLASIPVVIKLANVFDKKKALLINLSISATSSLLAWWFYTPANPWLQLVPVFINAPAWGAATILLPSMLADICDVDELESGLRREGLFGAVNTWIIKMGIAGATCLTGVVVALTGVNPDAPIQLASTVIKMRLAFAIIPFVFVMMAAFVISFYPLNEARANEVRAILEERRNKDHATSDSASNTLTAT